MNKVRFNNVGHKKNLVLKIGIPVNILFFPISSLFKVNKIFIIIPNNIEKPKTNRI